MTRAEAEQAAGLFAHKRLGIEFSQAMRLAAGLDDGQLKFFENQKGNEVKETMKKETVRIGGTEYETENGDLATAAFEFQKRFGGNFGDALITVSTMSGEQLTRFMQSDAVVDKDSRILTQILAKVSELTGIDAPIDALEYLKTLLSTAKI